MKNFLITVLAIGSFSPFCNAFVQPINGADLVKMKEQWTDDDSPKLLLYFCIDEEKGERT